MVSIFYQSSHSVFICIEFCCERIVIYTLNSNAPYFTSNAALACALLLCVPIIGANCTFTLTWTSESWLWSGFCNILVCICACKHHFLESYAIYEKPEYAIWSTPIGTGILWQHLIQVASLPWVTKRCYACAENESAGDMFFCFFHLPLLLKWQTLKHARLQLIGNKQNKNKAPTIRNWNTVRRTMSTGSWITCSISRPKMKTRIKALWHIAHHK